MVSFCSSPLVSGSAVQGLSELSARPPWSTQRGHQRKCCSQTKSCSPLSVGITSPARGRNGWMKRAPLYKSLCGWTTGLVVKYCTQPTEKSGLLWNKHLDKCCPSEFLSVSLAGRHRNMIFTNKQFEAQVYKMTD